MLDSGSSSTLIGQKFAKNLHFIPSEPTRWKTSAGTFSTHQKALVQFSLPELHSKRTILQPMHVTTAPMGYDVIIGRDIMDLLGIDLQFSTKTIKWDHAEISMRPNNCNQYDTQNFKNKGFLI